MCNTKTTTKSHRLDTLELTRHSRVKTTPTQGEIVLANRQKAKTITKAVNGKMCYLNSPIHKDYQAAYYCNEYLFQDGYKFTGKFCRKRNCTVCSRIKAAEDFQGYAPPLLDLMAEGELYLVTLTRVNVKPWDKKTPRCYKLEHEQLSKEVQVMVHNYSKASNNIRKTHGKKIVGIRKLEITTNNRTGYNPHYHLLVKGKDVAQLILSEWQRINGQSVHMSGQDIRKVYSVNGLLEVFKYVTKATVKHGFNPYAMDVMYQSIKGVRTIQPMNIKKVKPNKSEYDSMIVKHKGEGVDVWKWCQQRADWYTSDNESLNKFIPQRTKALKKTIESTPVKAIYDKAKEDPSQCERQATKIMHQARSEGVPKDLFD